MRKFILFTSLLAFSLSTSYYLLATIPAYAQISIPSFSSNQDISIEIIPEYPKPNETVYIGIESYLANINIENISWFINGKLFEEGIGEKSISFRAGKVGEATVIRVVGGGGILFDKSITIRPSEIDLIWEARTYTPPFYKGKALYSYQSDVVITAMPTIMDSSGVAISPDKLVYKWERNNRVIQSQSGYGRQQIILSGNSTFGVSNISVLVSYPNENIVAKGSISLRQTDLEIIVYEDHPLYGLLFENAVRENYILPRQEIELVAFPYFFSEASSAQYNWKINGVSSSGLSGKQNIVLRSPDGVSGFSRINIGIKNINRILQQTSLDLTIGFNIDN